MIEGKKDVKNILKLAKEYFENAYRTGEKNI